MTTLTPEQCQEQFKELSPEEQNILIMFAHEVQKAEDKHPSWPVKKNRHPDAVFYDDFVYAAAIVSEESGELLRAAIQYQYEGAQPHEMLKEAKQTGAMALRFLKNLPIFS